MAVYLHMICFFVLFLQGGDPSQERNFTLEVIGFRTYYCSFVVLYGWTGAPIQTKFWPVLVLWIYYNFHILAIQLYYVGCNFFSIDLCVCICPCALSIDLWIWVMMLIFTRKLSISEQFYLSADLSLSMQVATSSLSTLARYPWGSRSKNSDSQDVTTLDPPMRLQLFEFGKHPSSYEIKEKEKAIWIKWFQLQSLNIVLCQMAHWGVNGYHI